MLAGSALILLALPVFAIAGWPLRGWALAAVLWIAAQALAFLLTRLPLDAGNLAASGVRGIGMSFRAFVVGIPLVAVTVADSASASPPRSSTPSPTRSSSPSRSITFFGSGGEA